MRSFLDFKVPPNFDYKSWLRRWDRMQDRYLEGRQERFRLIADIIRATNPDARIMLELGCGTGSLLSVLSASFPAAEILALDHDPSMLFLAHARLKSSTRVTLVQKDIRLAAWPTGIQPDCDAVVSATALHWLREEQLSRLYMQISGLLKAGGVFINADHVGSHSDLLQSYWDRNRRNYSESRLKDDDWDGFWNGYSQALGNDVEGIHNEIADWYDPGIESGLPLSWHFSELKKYGFSVVECFWRRNGDAIYGAIK